MRQQVFNRCAVGRVGEKADKVCRHGIANLVDGDQVGGCGLDIGIWRERRHHRAWVIKMQRQKPRRCLPDLADAKGEDHPLEGDLAPSFDRCQKVADRHFAITVEFRQRVSPLSKPEDIGGPLYPAERDELVNLARAEPLDVKSVARAVPGIRGCLCSAGPPHPWGVWQVRRIRDSCPGRQIRHCRSGAPR